jgi:hypothetical protein
MAEQTKFNFTTKLHNCCATGEDAKLRPVMSAVHFKDGYAYATNAYIMVKSSLEYHSVINPEFLDGKAMHKDNFKEILKFESAECCDDGISCKNADGQVAFYEYFICDKAPNFDVVIPNSNYFKEVGQIGLNPKHLSDCCSAMYSDSGAFRLTFSGQIKAIRIDVIGYPDQIGIVMPMALSNSVFD